MVLLLRIYYEISLGQKSYWYPYLRLIPEKECINNWQEHELEMTQDTQLVMQLTCFLHQLELEWLNFTTILRQYPDIFPETFMTQSLFNICYSHVYSRCFGYGLDSTSMIPMADNLNHSCVDVTQELINLDLHKSGPADEQYYRVSKFLTDYTQIYTHRGQKLGNEDDR